MPILNSIPTASSLTNQYRGLSGKKDANSLRQRRQLVGQIRTARRSERIPAQASTQVMPSQPAPLPGPEAETFKPTSDFYQGNVADSAIYKQRLSEGNRALDARLSSMGLTNSGASIRNELDLVNKLTADETARMQDLAVNDANRYDSRRESLANRQERLGQNQIDNTLRTVEMFLNQNPMRYAFQGQDTYNDTQNRRATGNASVIGSNTPLQTGGTGRPPPTFDPGFAPGPNTSQVDIFKIMNGQQTNNDYMSTINNILGLFR
jgi:hypothetical protein